MADEATDVSLTPQEEAKKEKKAKRIWTVEKCLKVAKRFETLEAWKMGAPSSFKSAQSHGWIESCSAHMKQGSKPIQKNQPKSPAAAPKRGKSVA